MTNGETTDYADTTAGTSPSRPELSEGCADCGFVFPDDEALDPGRIREDPAVRPRRRQVGGAPGRTRRRTSGTRSSPSTCRRPRSTRRTAPSPCSTSGSTSRTATRRRCASSRSAASAPSRSSTRSTAAPSRAWRPRNGPAASATASGTRHLLPRHRGHDHRDQPRRTASKVWFEGGGQTSDSFTYTAVSETGNPVLVMAAEDYTGASPVQTPARITSATTRTRSDGQRHRLRRLRRRRQRPHGPRRPRRPQPLRRRRLVHGQRHRHPRAGLARRERVATGHAASCSRSATTSTRAASCCTPASTPGTSTPPATAPSATTRSTTSSARRRRRSRARCRTAAGLGRRRQRRHRVLVRGAPRQRGRRARSRHRRPARRRRRRGPVHGHGLWSFNGADSAENQDHNASFITTSGLLPVADYPQFESRAVAKYDRPGGPFEPHTRRRLRLFADRGHLLQAADAHDQRARWRADRCPSGSRATPRPTGTTCSSRRTHVGQDDWTTLPDANGTHERCHGRELPGRMARPAPIPRPLPDAQRGRDLLADRNDRHLERRQRRVRATGSSGTIDLSAYAGDQIEVSITLRQRLGEPGTRRLHRRCRAADRREHVVRDGPRRLGRSRPARRQRRQPERLHPRRPPAASPRAPWSRRPTRSTWASVSRASPVPQIEPWSWDERWTTCCPDRSAAKTGRSFGSARSFDSLALALGNTAACWASPDHRGD